MTRESMDFDVVIVGAGPSGLSSAIRLKQLNPDIQVVVVEKGSEVGAHILSGAVMEPRAMNELFPNWKELGAPLNTPVSDEKFMFLKEKGQINWPTSLLIPQQKNHGTAGDSFSSKCSLLIGRRVLSKNGTKASDSSFAGGKWRGYVGTEGAGMSARKRPPRR